MRALVLTRPSTLELRAVPDAVAAHGQVVVKVEAAGIGGGEIFQLHNPTGRTFPSIMGHGIVGTARGLRVAVDPITACERCAFCTTGRRQHCARRKMIGFDSDGGFAELVAVPENNLHHLPDSMSWEQATFIEPFANAVHAWKVAEAHSAVTVGVIGAGAIGLGVVAYAAQQNIATIAVSELADSRRRVALALGATSVGQGLTEQHDIVFDAVGTARSRAAAVTHTTAGGTVVLLGLESANPGFDAIDVVRRELRIQASYVYLGDEFAEAIALASTTQSDWIANYGFENVQEIIDDFSVGDYEVVRAALRLRSQ
ncbi:MAG: alcohol dehydrogenase catalytic domain-containing protein [Acidimicrobiales bacterium]